MFARLTGANDLGFLLNISDQDRKRVTLKDDLLHYHAYLRINYTTYDLRRAQDVVNTSSKPNIMLISNEDPEPDLPSHPYWYARVLGILHVNVRDEKHSDPTYHRVEVLWIRWYGRFSDVNAGWQARRLDAVGYVPQGKGAFGFIDPRNVLRAAHLIPSFEHGYTQELLPKSTFWDTPEGDYEQYYANRYEFRLPGIPPHAYGSDHLSSFVDRDMGMRYVGQAVGHSHLKIEHLENEMKAYMRSRNGNGGESSADSLMVSPALDQDFNNLTEEKEGNDGGGSEDELDSESVLNQSDDDVSGDEDYDSFILGGEYRL